MTPERYQQVCQLYHTASELAPNERAAFLDSACGGDQELRREVSSMLRGHERAGNYFAAPAMEVAAGLLARKTPPSLTGQSLNHYQVLSLLGAGGMGEVYLAEDTKLRRKVAIKLLPAEFTRDTNRVRRFEQEARAASALSHPNIITIYEIGQVDTTHYLVTEFVAGETLRQQITQNRLGIGAALEIAAQIASALAAAHAAGVVHRDIKPENVIVRSDGLVKVLDFGLAKLIELNHATVETKALTVNKSLTEPGQVMGTPNYMSPEQARGQKVDHKTDIFSLGVLLYEMIAGRRPFEGATMSDVIAALLTTEPPPLSLLGVAVPAELERIVKKCLAKDREVRYQSANELIAELKVLSSGSQAGEATARRIEAVRGKFVSRRWTVATAIVVVLMMGLAYVLYLWRASTIQPDQIKSLAVLPLENLSGDTAQDYFADGMTETLIAGLAKVSALRVSARTSVLQYQRARKPLADVARELNVDAVVEGSVQRFGERVRITARLIHAPTERQLWGETYQRDLRDALALQSEIAQAVVQQIEIKLTPQEQMRLASTPPVNPTAYDDYLRGRFYANRQIKADNETAIKTLERAVATDPIFAAAQAELAQAYVWRFFLFTPDEKQWEEKAFVAVEKALALDPDSAVAHLARGRLLWTPANHFPHEQAIQEYRRALALNPTLDEAQNQLALVYNHLGLFDQALQELQKAVMVNPTNNLAQFRIGETFLFQGRYEPALAALRKTPREVNPQLVGSTLAMALLHLGRRDEAAAIVEEFLKGYPGDTNVGLFTGIQALLAALAGEENRAEAKIRSAIEKGKGFGHFHHTAYNIACAYAVMNKAEPAIEWLQAAADGGFPCHPMFENDPFLNNLRKDARFIALMAKLKEQWEYYQARL